MTPLVEELIPCPDPWDVARKLAHLPNLLFLDSADRTTERGRFSYVAADAAPITDPQTDIQATLTKWASRFLTIYPDPFCSVRSILEPGIDHISGLPPFQGGLVAMFGYQLGQAFERLPRPMYDEFLFDDVVTATYDWVVSFDHWQQRCWLVSTGVEYFYDEITSTRARADERFRFVRELLGRNPYRPLPQTSRAGGALSKVLLAPQFAVHDYPGISSNFSRDQYLAAVRKAIDYVHAGDCFQVNLSQRLLAPLREHPLELYGRLRQRNPAPYGCYLDLGDFQILSASPEQFLKVSNGEVVTRPIKGTRPRGKTPEEDARIARELQANPKDRAENVMIVDLLRNDLGRVCEYGSIHVPKVCEVETFAHVHHLVSEVRGKLRPDKTPFDLLRAAFPGGSVTGAPKVRAMEIIAELEPTARGPYCGSLGYVGFDGAMDTSILIRTFTAGRGWVQFPVGGGIVADSDPEREYEETLHKAAGLLRALE